MKDGKVVEKSKAKKKGKGEKGEENGDDSLSENSFATLPFDWKNHQGCILIAQTSKDVAFLENISSLPRSETQENVIWHTFDDRNMFRPTEDVHVKGYLRLFVRTNEAFGYRKVVSKEKLRYFLKDSRGQLVHEGDLQTNQYGAFDVTVTLPDNINLGSGRVEFLWERSNSTNSTHNHTFHVQEFRRPQFKVESSLHSKGPYSFQRYSSFADPYVSSPILKAKASYYAGGVLPDNDVKWTVTSSEAHFTPPGLSKFLFTNSSPLIGGSPKYSLKITLHLH